MPGGLAEHLPGSVLIGEEQADSLRLEEGITTLDQVTDFVRTAITDTTPEEVCGLIDRGSGEPTGTFWTFDPIDGTKGFLAPRAICRGTGIGPRRTR